MNEKEQKPALRTKAMTETSFLASASDAAPAPAPAPAAAGYTEEDLWTAFEYAVLSARGEGGPSTRQALLAYVKAHKKS